jgi:outer membrane lipoprotein SlyB
LGQGNESDAVKGGALVGALLGLVLGGPEGALVGMILGGLLGAVLESFDEGEVSSPRTSA